MLSKFQFLSYQSYRPLTNLAIEEDADEPKIPSHLDYKYIKSYEGPMTKPNQKANNMGVIKEEDAPGKSIRTKKGKTKG